MFQIYFMFWFFRTLLASTHVNHNIYITEVKTGKCVHSLIGHRRTPWCVTFHPTISGLIASGCLDGEVRIWDLHVSISFSLRVKCRHVYDGVVNARGVTYLVLGTAPDWGGSLSSKIVGSLTKREPFVLSQTPCWILLRTCCETVLKYVWERFLLRFLFVLGHTWYCSGSTGCVQGSYCQGLVGVLP